MKNKNLKQTKNLAAVTSPLARGESYDAAVVEQRREANAAAIEEINGLQAEVTANHGNMFKCAVRIFNAVRKQGELLQTLCGREHQLTLQSFQQFQDQLPFGFEDARRRIGITCRYGHDIRQWEELAVETQKDVLKQLQFIGIADAQQALSDAGARVSDPFTLFLKSVTTLKQELLKAVRATPMEEQSPERLRDFLADTQWIEEARDRAKKLLV